MTTFEMIFLIFASLILFLISIALCLGFIFSGEEIEKERLEERAKELSEVGK